MDKFLSVVIPAYNEEVNFHQNKLQEVYKYLSMQKYSFELILVNDGSTDNTLALLNDFAKSRENVRVVNEPHRGKAGTVKAGMLIATGKLRLFADFDQSTPIEEVEKMLPLFDKGFDLVIGSRELNGSSREREPWFRHIMGKGFNFGVQLIAVRGIKDTQCGFKLLTAGATKKLFPLLRVTMSPAKYAFTGAFDVELLFLARKYGLKTAEVPVLWKHVASVRVDPIRDSVRMAIQVIKIRLSYILNQYKA